MLCDQQFAEFSHQIGLASLGADEDEIKKISMVTIAGEIRLTKLLLMVKIIQTLNNFLVIFSFTGLQLKWEFVKKATKELKSLELLFFRLYLSSK